MKISTPFKTAIVAASVVLLASCGGGDDAEAGGPTEFSVVPDKLEGTAAAGSATCIVDNTGTPKFTILGGAGPYRITSSNAGMIPHPAVVEKQGDQFTIELTGTCFDPASLVIMDKLNKSVVVTVSNKIGT